MPFNEETVIQTEQWMQQAVLAHKPKSSDHWYYWPMIFIGVYSNGFSHRTTVGMFVAIALALLTLFIVEGSLYTLEDGLRTTFKNGSQRTLAWIGKWLIKMTMVANAAYSPRRFSTFRRPNS